MRGPYVMAGVWVAVAVATKGTMRTVAMILAALSVGAGLSGLDKPK